MELDALDILASTKALALELMIFYLVGCGSRLNLHMVWFCL
jgi:hypothetical protein